MDTTRILHKIDSTIISNNKVYYYTTVETTEKGLKLFDSHFFEALVWPITILIILNIFKKEISNLFSSVIKRLNDGSDVTLGIISFKQGQKIIESNETDNFDSSKNILSALIKDEVNKKILSTFWKEQNKLDKTYNIRWTFIKSGEDFGLGITKLVLAGLVAFDPKSEQYYLTDFGLEQCRANDTLIGSFSFFEK